MPEYTKVESQIVSLNQNVLFDDKIPCNRGIVYHRPNSGIFTLKGKSCQCRARYKITFAANVGTMTETPSANFSLAIAINGEIDPSTIATTRPADMGQFFTIGRTTIIDVPADSSYTISIKNVSEFTDPITVSAANIIIERIA